MGKPKRGGFFSKRGTNLGGNYDSATTLRRKVFLKRGVPLKYANFLKNTSKGIHL